ncbi:S-layer homology domain-containing protein [Paenibacillus hexagrammi]|uniref:S-layer homology domain-containing protein n=1 Tax=Paenibacillus hexagrammi TaxID=2908839 RepID=A0ABY3SD50_9BACL|nr:S-layer homology domain-containing protein [Paenibacillus sp. YPD9-1]UJF31410.1 S-layer homology domain-containing protein [Paenibacillus sp. YPD9-1]
METRAADSGAAFNSNYMKYVGNVNADGGGVYTVHVKPYSIMTVSTLQSHDKPDFHTPLPVEGQRTVLDTDATGAIQNIDDHFLYADDFDYTSKTVPVIGSDGQISGSESYVDSRGGSKSVIPRYTSDRNGAFEAYLPDGSSNYVLRQQLDQAIMGLGGTWNGGNPVTGIGDNRWLNYKASVDVSFENNSTQSGSNYAAIGAREQGGGSSQDISGTPYVFKYWFDGGWQLLVNNSAVSSGNVVSGAGGVQINGFNVSYDAWHNIAIQVAGNVVTAYLDGTMIATYTDSAPKLSGRVDLASGYYNVQFDNLKVETVDGYAPYYSELLDNMEMYDLAPTPNAKLVYTGAWNHQDGQGMYVYQRSISTSQGADAALSYTFTGTGFDILGANDGSAKLEVTVDGQVVTTSAATAASKEFYQTFTLRGLAYGEHTVSVKVLSGTLNVDAVGVVSGEVKGSADTSDLQTAVTAAQEVSRQDEFKDSDWQLFESLRSTAQEALTDPSTYRLDQEGAEQLIGRLTYIQNQMVMGDIQSIASPLYVATSVGKLPNLPQQVEASNLDGTKKMVTVKWNLDGISFHNAYETVAVTGTYGNLQTVCYVEVVPENILYFVDLNATQTGLTSGHSSSNTLGYDSPAYGAVAAFAAANSKPLLNNAPDQIYDSTNGWGHGGQNSSGAYSVSYKGIVAGPYSKQSTTGIYTANQIGASVFYTFDNVPAGDNQITLGTYNWWSNVTRTEEVYLVHDNNEELVDTITLNSSTVDVSKTYNFTMAEAGKMTIKLVAAQAAQSPLMSFVGIAPVPSVPPADKTVLQAVYDEQKNKVNDQYTELSWSSFQDALTEANRVLEDTNATQDDVDVALQALNSAVDGLTQDVVADTTKPTITLLGEPIVNLSIGAVYTDAGVSAMDDRDGDITSQTVTTITYNGILVPNISTVTAATYLYHYNVSDAAGNAALEVTRTINIMQDDEPIVDTVKPVITLLGDASVTLSAGASYTDAGATATDDLDGNITSRIVTTIMHNGNVVPSINTGEAGTYTYHYNVSDAAGNSAVEVTRSVTVNGVDDHHSSHSSSGSSSPSVPSVPETTKVIGAEELKAPGKGSVTVQVAQNQDTVLLPGHIADLVGDHGLRLETPNMTIEFPKEVLQSIQGMNADDQSDEAQIQFSAKPASKEDADKRIQHSDPAGSVKLKTASQVYDFSLQITSADGTVVPVTTFKQPLTITFKVDPSANPDLLGVYYLKADGEPEFIGGTLVNGVMSAQVNHFSQYAVLEYNKTFADVSDSSWASKVIKKMAAKHIIEGVGSSNFEPQGNVTRAQFAAMLSRALGLSAVNGPVFTDVDPHAWYADAIAKVSKAGIVNGRSSDTFAPDAAITREEMAVMTVRAYDFVNAQQTAVFSPSSFNDQDQIQAWAQDAVASAQQLGLVNGRSNNLFAPQELMTRAESAQVISNLLK